MTKNFDAEVLICGSGAAGLTLAIDLARRGVSFLLIEKTADPFRGSRGKGIKPRSQEIFEDLGVLDRIVAAGGIYPPDRDYQDDGTYQDSTDSESQAPTPTEPYHIALLVPQFRTEGVLRERLAELGSRPRYGCELQSFEQDDSGVTAHIVERSGTRTLRVRYLVGTDGGRSFVRHALGVDFPGKTLGVRAIVADVTLSGLSRDAWHRFKDGSMAQIFICPLPGTDLFQLQGPIPLEGDVDLSAEGLSKLVAERTRRDDIQIQSVSWASAYNMNERLADRYRVGRVFLAGDAAHIHPPTGGLGLNTSLQDSYNLGWKLAAVLRGAPDALLDTYEEERRPIAALTLGLTTKLLDAMKRGEMRRGREVKQLDLGYPESSLAMESAGRQGAPLLAGDRAPDAPVRGVAGQPTRLFELFKGPSWTLLGYETDRTAIAPRAHLHIHVVGLGGDIVDEKSVVKDAYGVAPGDWVLVRPDGYVGAIISTGEIAALESYMGNVGLTNS